MKPGNARGRRYLVLGILMGFLFGWWVLPGTLRAETTIGKAKAVGSLFRTSTGKYVLFYGAKHNVDSCVTSAGKEGKAWGKPLRILRYRTAVVDGRDNVYIASCTKNTLVLDMLVPGKEGWEYRKDAAVICRITGGKITRQGVHIFIKGEKIWAACYWADDGQKVFKIKQADLGKLEFREDWEDTTGLVTNLKGTRLEEWGGEPALYVPLHYVVGLLYRSGGKWKEESKFFEFKSAQNGGWVGAYGAPPARSTSSDDGILHIGQYVSGKSGQTILISIPRKDPKAYFIEVGAGAEVIQFLAVQGKDVIVGMKYTTIEGEEGMEITYKDFYAIRAVPDGAPGKYKLAEMEITVTNSDKGKGGMVSLEKIPPGEKIPVVYIEGGQMVFKYLKEE